MINISNLTDKTWYDIYERNTIKYDKFNGFNFNLDELEDFFCDKFTGIQRAAHIDYDGGYQMDGDKYYIPCTVSEIDLVRVRELWNPSLFDQNYSFTKYYGTVLFIRYNHLQCLLIIFKACSDE